MKTFIKFCLWLLAFVPIIVDNSVFFPYISGKSLLIRIGIAIGFTLFSIYFLTSKNFRKEVYFKIKRIIRNPLFIIVSLFIFFTIISTIFAFNKYRAFFGDVERAEGLVGILFFFGFFILSLLVFERKDWLWFFKLGFFATAMLVVKEFIEFTINPAGRPISYSGNPTFLAGYLLFSLTTAFIVFKEAQKEPNARLFYFWRISSVVIAIISIAGIFMSQTRGAILGLGLGIIALAIYWCVKGKDIVIFRGINLRKISIGFLALIVVFAGVFFATRHLSFWQKVPGLGRIAQLNFGDLRHDPTIQTRFISVGVSLKAINPRLNGIEKLLVGWGPENFTFAYNKYYNPKYYQYEHAWFDRAHNKLLDTFVMNGVLGLLSYLALWGSFIWLVFKKRGFFSEVSAIFVFGIAYFFNLFFVFDQVSTYIPFFAALSFLIFVSSIENNMVIPENNAKKQRSFQVYNQKDIIVSSVFGLVSIFFFVGLFVWTVVPYMQMRGYLNLLRSPDLEKNIDSIFTPYTYAQQDIRSHFFQTMLGYYGTDKKYNNLFEKSLNMIEDLTKKELAGPRQFILVGQGYEKKGRTLNNIDFLKKADDYYRKAFEMAPYRQDVTYMLALNLAYQNKFNESISLLKQSLKLNDEVPETRYYLGIISFFYGDKYYKEALNYLESALNNSVFNSTLANPGNASVGLVTNIYEGLSKYFYYQHDKENLITILKRLKEFNPEKAAQIDQLLKLVEKGLWHLINV